MLESNSKINVVMFWFMNDWGLYGRAYEKIAEALSTDSRIDRVICAMPATEADGWLTRPFHLNYRSKKLWVVTPRRQVAPKYTAPLRQKFHLTQAIYDASFSILLRSLGIQKNNTLLWLFPPHDDIRRLCLKIPHFARVVQIVDNNVLLSNATEAYREKTREQYHSLAGSADCVLVSSDLNFGIFSRINCNCLKFENAIDTPFLQEVSCLPYRKSKGRPRLGYLGWITERTDLSLIAKLALDRPDYDIVLAGPVAKVDITNLVSLRNVAWIGQVPYEKAPETIKGFDVCLLPHVDTGYSRSMSPLKLFQYLGSGRPVVTTRVAGVERWREHILVSDSPDEFVMNVDRAITDDSLGKAQKRIDAVRGETWDKRVREMLEGVLTCLP